MAKPSRVDVVIIGGGPVGMALACELIRHGLSVRIFDKAAQTKKYSRAPIFWPRAQDALDLMGLHHLWDGTTSPMRRMNVKVYGKPAGRVELGFGESAHPVAMLVGQDVSEAILDRQLTLLGKPVERSAEATDVVLRETGGTVTVRHADGIVERVSASWVVGCEGTESILREKASIGWEGNPLRGLMVPVADAQASWTLPTGDGDAYVTLTDRGYLLAIPLPGVWRVIVATPDDTPPGEKPSTTLEGVQDLAAEAIGGPVKLSDAPWVSVVRYGNYIAPDFRKGRALLAGDAAHSIAPLSGQGMNTGVQDAFNLGWKIAYVHKGWAPDALLDSYSADRRPVAARLVKTTNRFFHAVLKPGTTQQRVARIVAPIALRFAKVRRMIAGFYTETDVSYRSSPLNDDYARQEPRPGDHARDGNLIRWPDRVPMRLYDALRGVHWTVLLFSGAAPDDDELDTLVDQLCSMIDRIGRDRLKGLVVVGEPNTSITTIEPSITIAIDAWRRLHGKYDAERGALVLVRPDGYVSFHRSSDISSFAALFRHLNKHLTFRPPIL